MGWDIKIATGMGDEWPSRSATVTYSTSGTYDFARGTFVTSAPPQPRRFAWLRRRWNALLDKLRWA